MIPKFLTGFHIKLIALITMLTDHIAAIVLMGIGKRFGFSEGLCLAIDIMRGVGRLSFPLFCFLLVQGFFHSKSRGRYALRLGVFAIVSEPFYDMAFSESLFDFGKNNVFFTLLFGFLLLWSCDHIKSLIEKRGAGQSRGVILWGTASLLCCLAFMSAPWLFNSSYGCAGVLAIAIMALLYEYPFAGQFMGVMAIALILDSQIQLYALGTLPIVLLYNGKRGPSLKYLFYGFYPLHLFILVVCKYALWGGGLPKLF